MSIKVFCFFFFFIYSKYDWFILFYSDAKPKIPWPHREQYNTRSWKSGVGYAGHDEQLEGRVISFVIWHYTIAEQHMENNTAELNWNVAQTWQVPGIPSSTPPLGWTRYLDFSVGRITILWKNKKFTLLQFHRRILRPKHSGFISLHLQGQSWWFTQNHIKKNYNPAACGTKTTFTEIQTRWKGRGLCTRWRNKIKPQKNN